MTKKGMDKSHSSESSDKNVILTMSSKRSHKQQEVKASSGDSVKNADRTLRNRLAKRRSCESSSECSDEEVKNKERENTEKKKKEQKKKASTQDSSSEDDSDSFSRVSNHGGIHRAEDDEITACASAMEVVLKMIERPFDAREYTGTHHKGHPETIIERSAMRTRVLDAIEKEKDRLDCPRFYIALKGLLRLLFGIRPEAGESALAKDKMKSIKKLPRSEATPSSQASSAQWNSHGIKQAKLKEIMKATRDYIRAFCAWNGDQQVE